MNPLQQLREHGQSPWLDTIRRNLIASGQLKRLVEEDGLGGVTSNPSIFEKAIAGSSDYDATIADLHERGETDPGRVFEALAVEDVRDACDVLRSVYDATGGADGFVSIEVSPGRAYETEATLEEARRLWREIDRPNLMVKVPGTPQGIPAIRTLLSEGVNVNITLLFSGDVWAQVAEAHMAALEARDGDLSGIASVASFFVSRIDTLLDPELPEDMRGKAAIANAKVTYARWQEIIASDRWQALAARGARPQRLLWASTSTKNPAYRDVLYVEELIGRDTVNTMPQVTLDAFRDHGRVEDTLTRDVDEARAFVERIQPQLDAATAQLLEDGVKQFADAFDKLVAAVQERIASGERRAHQRTHLPPDLKREVEQTLAEWADGDKVARLWKRDKTLWTSDGEDRWMGWLDVAENQLEHASHLRRLAEEGRAFDHALLLGMGGSSLAPETLALTFGHVEGHPELIALDSTDPDQVRAVEERIDVERTLFIVSSKSGTTLEPNILRDHFLALARERLGDEAPRRFIAITDPGSPLEEEARRDGFRHIAHGRPSIGGRYSALSDFGMVPAAIAGIDVEALLHRADRMAKACDACVPADENPGLVLGATIGVAARSGRDKLTIVASPGIEHLGAWLEQLLAESTGKDGRGVIPVDREPVGPPEAYGDDRLFAYLRLDAAPDAQQDAAVDALAQAGQPVLRIHLNDPVDVAGEFFRWELATAVAGSILGINPFDQPDVEASKVETRKLTSAYEEQGSLPENEPVRLDGDGAADRIRELLGQVGPGDYVALLAYIPRNAEHERALDDIRVAIRERTRAATCVGFGPRFLHSTGQAYKGGPNTGVFLQLTADHHEDVPVPGHRYTFGVVEAAQAEGDFKVLRERGRRALHVHLGAPEDGLRRLRELVG